MIFEKVNLNNKTVFEIPIGNHKDTWEFYFKQYANVLDYIVSLSLKKEYKINSKQMAVMFIYRHTVELFLKYLIDKNGNIVQETHSLDLLTQDLNGVLSQDFLNSLPILKPTGDGDNFRYINSKGGNSHYNGEKLDVLPSLSLFLESAEIKKEGLFTCKTDLNDKKLRNEWTLHTNETRELGQLKTQYDDLITTLLKAIVDKELAAADIYLPLLFLIRHSLELGLKDNAYEVINKLSKTRQNKVISHSLESLFNIISDYVKDAKGKMTPNDDAKIMGEINYYLPKLETLSKNLHNVDLKSHSFRFPDVNGSTITSNLLYDSIETVQEIDSFISLSLKLLNHYGYLS